MRGLPPRRSLVRTAALAAALVGVSTLRPGRVAAEGGVGPGDIDFWSPNDVAVGDLDGDGRDDLCVLQTHIPGFASRLLRYLQDADRPGYYRLLPPVQTGSGGWRVRLADVDGDGLPEAVTADDRTVSIARFAAGEVRVFRTGGPVWSVTTGDVDGDGRTDVVASAATGTFLVAQSATAPGDFVGPDVIGPPSDCAAVGDFAGGPEPDVALASSDRPLRVQTDRAAGAWTTVLQLPSRHGKQSLEAADIDGDGRAELVHVAGSRNGRRRIAVYLDPVAEDSEPVVSWTTAAAAWTALADFDRDGRPDLAFGSSRRVAWMRQRDDEPGRFTRGSSRGFGRFLGNGSVGDARADGFPDIVVCRLASVRIVPQDPLGTGRLLHQQPIRRAD